VTRKKKAARRHRKQPEKEKAVIEKLWHDREFMARPIKEENMNEKTHCDFVKTRAKGENLV
jgi:hypothetical protein